MLPTLTVVVRGGGDLASGVAHRLQCSGFRVTVTELPRPLVVRRAVAFASAVLEGTVEIEGVRAQLVESVAAAQTVMDAGRIAVRIDPQGTTARALHADAVVDAIMAKVNTGTHIDNAPAVIALGPGFTAGVDCHAVVETNRGHNLGRVYYEGSAEPDTHEPNPIGGVAAQRVLRAPADGIFTGTISIGDVVRAGDIVGNVDGIALTAGIGGCLRGLIADGAPVHAGLKIGDIDPRGERAYCFTISDKSRAIGGGVLEALLHLSRATR